MPISYITYKGKKILHADFKDLKDKDAVLENLERMKEHYLEAEDKILLLADLRGTFSNPEIMDKLKYYGKTVFHGRSVKRAVIGIVGVKKILLKAYNVFTSNEVIPFESEEEAKDYLVS